MLRQGERAGGVVIGGGLERVDGQDEQREQDEQSSGDEQDQGDPVTCGTHVLRFLRGLARGGRGHGISHDGTFAFRIFSMFLRLFFGFSLRRVPSRRASARG